MGDIDPSLNLNAHIIHAFSKKVRTKLQSSVSHISISYYGQHTSEQQRSTYPQVGSTFYIKVYPI